MGRREYLVFILHHESQGTPRLDIAVDELGKNIQTDPIIGDGLDDPNGEGEAKGDDHGEKKRPPREIGGIGENCNESQYEHLVTMLDGLT